VLDLLSFAIELLLNIWLLMGLILGGVLGWAISYMLWGGSDVLFITKATIIGGILGVIFRQFVLWRK
jgi:hypothetical protein